MNLSSGIQSAMFGFGGCALALFAAQAAGVIDAQPRAEQLVLRGARESRVVVGYQTDAGEVPGLWLYDGEGKLRVELVYDPGDQEPEHQITALRFMNDEGEPVASVASRLISHHGRSSAFTIRPDGAAEDLVELGANSFGPHLELGSKDSDERILMYTQAPDGEEHQSTLRMITGDSSFRLSVSEDGVYANAWTAEQNSIHGEVEHDEPPTLQWRQGNQPRAEARFK